MTLATVYSTLETLEQAGFVRALPFQKQARYDANLSPHANLVCVGCGGVVDSREGKEIVNQMLSRLEETQRFRVHRAAHRLLRLVPYLRRAPRPQDTSGSNLASVARGTKALPPPTKNHAAWASCIGRPFIRFNVLWPAKHPL